MLATGLAVAGLAAATVGLATGCEPAVPANPTYAADVRPIFMSRCTRCHGDGGNLNTEYAPTGPDAAILNDNRFVLNDNNGFLNQFLDTVDGAPGCCTLSGGNFPASPGCMAGAYHEATLGRLALYLPTMPPAPAPMLDDWELKVITAWMTNPICDTTANPDPALCSGAAAFASCGLSSTDAGGQ